MCRREARSEGEFFRRYGVFRRGFDFLDGFELDEARCHGHGSVGAYGAGIGAGSASDAEFVVHLRDKEFLEADGLPLAACGGAFAAGDAFFVVEYGGFVAVGVGLDGECFLRADADAFSAAVAFVRVKDGEGFFDGEERLGGAMFGAGSAFGAVLLDDAAVAMEFGKGDLDFFLVGQGEFGDGSFGADGAADVAVEVAEAFGEVHVGFHESLKAVGGVGGLEDVRGTGGDAESASRAAVKEEVEVFAAGRRGGVAGIGACFGGVEAGSGDVVPLAGAEHGGGSEDGAAEEGSPRHIGCGCGFGLRLGCGFGCRGGAAFEGVGEARAESVRIAGGDAVVAVDAAAGVDFVCFEVDAVGFAGFEAVAAFDAGGGVDAEAEEGTAGDEAEQGSDGAEGVAVEAAALPGECEGEEDEGGDGDEEEAVAHPVRWHVGEGKGGCQRGVEEEVVDVCREWVDVSGSEAGGDGVGIEPGEEEGGASGHGGYGGKEDGVAHIRYRLRVADGFAGWFSAEEFVVKFPGADGDVLQDAEGAEEGAVYAAEEQGGGDQADEGSQCPGFSADGSEPGGDELDALQPVGRFARFFVFQVDEGAEEEDEDGERRQSAEGAEHGCGGRLGEGDAPDAYFGEVAGADAHACSEVDVADVSVLVAEEFGGGSIDGDDVGTDEEGLGVDEVVGVLAFGAVAEHGAVGVEDVEVGLAQEDAVGDALVQVVVVEEGAVPDEAHGVFHAGGHACAAVVFEDGYVDVNVGVEDGLMDFGLFEFDGLRVVVVAVHGFVGSADHFSAVAFDGFLNAAVFIDALPGVAGVVEDEDLGGSGILAEFDEASDDVRMGVGGEFGRFVPRTVGFDDDALSGFDEGSDSAEDGEACFKHGDARSVANGDEGGRASGGFVRFACGLRCCCGEESAQGFQGEGSSDGEAHFQEVSALHDVGEGVVLACLDFNGLFGKTQGFFSSVRRCAAFSEIVCAACRCGGYFNLDARRLFLVWFHAVCVCCIMIVLPG